MPLPVQLVFTLLAFIAAAGLLLTGRIATIAGYHIVFALGILPLILAAMAHFVPVLTRSRSSGRTGWVVPLAAWVGGLQVVLYFIFPQRVPAGHYLGAILAASAVAVFIFWTANLRRRCLGTPHPCLDWYIAALACLVIGLCAILAGHWLPEQRASLRLLHLHLNTLGFVGITALGTLQVLVPTVAQKSDPDTFIRMRLHLKWIMGGTLVTAFTAAWQPALSWVGLALMAIPLAAILEAWLKLYAPQIFKLHGSLPCLGAALAGFILVLMLGAAHGYFRIEFHPVAAFIVAFLMPLVTGAAGYLLPLWARPGMPTAWHHQVRRWLGFGSGLRAAFLLAGGLMVGLGLEEGWGLALLAVATFVAQCLLAITLAGTEKAHQSNANSAAPD